MSFQSVRPQSPVYRTVSHVCLWVPTTSGPVSRPLFYWRGAADEEDALQLMRSWWWWCWDEKAAAAAAGTGWSDGRTGADGCFETGAGHMSQQPARMMGWARLPGPGKTQSARWGGGRALNPGLSVWSPPGCLPSPGRRRSSAAD